MKVVRQHGPGGPEAPRVDEVEPPRPGPGELLVAVGAAGVSLPQVRAGRTTSGPWPVAPGGEVAGRVTAVGAEVEGWAVGDHGNLAQRWPEQYAADADELWRLLRDGRVTPAVHATLPLTDAGEAHRVLEQRRNLGKVVLVPDR